MDTEEIELEDLDYINKFTERLYVIISNINAGCDISEEDYDILKAIHKIMYEGNLPLYKVISTECQVTTTQTDLFSENISST